MTHFKRFILAPVILTILCLCIPGTARALEKTSIVLQWLPQAQFAGFLVARDKGFYTEAGLDLSIIFGGPDVLASHYLETGKADFATMFLATGIQHSTKHSMVNIGQFVQHSALMLITLKSSGIETIDDLEGKKIGLWADEFQIQAQALFKQKGISVKVVPQTDSLDLFLRGGVQAASGMWYNEYHTLFTYGFEESELRPFFFRDYGLDFPEDGIYCLKSTWEQKADIGKALVQATIKGWRYAFDHPEEALDVIMQQMIASKVPANRAHQRWMLNRMKDIMVDENRPMGILHEADYEHVRRTLVNEGFIDRALSFDAFYKGEK